MSKTVTAALAGEARSKRKAMASARSIDNRVRAMKSPSAISRSNDLSRPMPAPIRLDTAGLTHSVQIQELTLEKLCQTSQLIGCETLEAIAPCLPNQHLRLAEDAAIRGGQGNLDPTPIPRCMRPSDIA